MALWAACSCDATKQLLLRWVTRENGAPRLRPKDSPPRATINNDNTHTCIFFFFTEKKRLAVERNNMLGGLWAFFGSERLLFPEHIEDSFGKDLFLPLIFVSAMMDGRLEEGGMPRRPRNMDRPSATVYDRRLRSTLSSESLLAPLSAWPLRSSRALSSKSLRAVLPPRLERPEALATDLNERDVGPEAYDDLDEELKAIKTSLARTEPSHKRDALLVAAIGAQSRAPKRTFITASGTPENVELYPNYGSELRRKKITEAKLGLLTMPNNNYAPSPVVRVYHHG